jgi:hypothetical protein
MTNKASLKKRLAQIEIEQKLHEAEQSFRVLKSNAQRARSITAGTAFGGVVEVSMRGDNGDALWCLLQPVEAIELINQLAAGVGCHIAIKPRKDFSSWRGWNPEEAQLEFSGHAPFSNPVPIADTVGAKLPPPKKQPGMKLTRSAKNVVATKKTVNRRSVKRAAKAS